MLFAALARSLLDSGHEVHIVTAVGHRRKHTVAADVDATGVPATTVKVLIFDHPRQAPVLKRDYCLAEGIQLFIDDRLDTCRVLRDSGVLSLNILKGGGG